MNHIIRRINGFLLPYHILDPRSSKQENVSSHIPFVEKPLEIHLHGSIIIMVFLYPETIHIHLCVFALHAVFDLWHKKKPCRIEDIILYEWNLCEHAQSATILPY